MFGYLSLSLCACHLKTKEEPMKKGTYGYDVTFFEKQDIATVELKYEAGASVLIIPKYQGRVMTSSANGEAGASCGWINHDYIEANDINDKFNPVGGEERFWFGPEGGPFSIYFDKDKAQSFENWRVPSAIDTDVFDVVSQSPTSVSLEKSFVLQNTFGTNLNIHAARQVSLISKAEAQTLLGTSIATSINMVGYETQNTLTNNGTNAWTKDTGFLSIWLLCMFSPSEEGVVFAPYVQGEESELGEVVKGDYFGQIGEDRLFAKDGFVFFKVDGKQRGKIGLSAQRSTPYCGSYDPIQKMLTILWYNKPEEDMKYVNAQWGEQEDPLKGDVVNAYNDGPTEDGSVMGPFYEIESSSPAALLQPKESLTHVQHIFHFTGEEDKLNDITMEVFGISLAEIKSAF